MKRRMKMKLSIPQMVQSIVSDESGITDRHLFSAHLKLSTGAQRGLNWKLYSSRQRHVEQSGVGALLLAATIDYHGTDMLNFQSIGFRQWGSQLDFRKISKWD